MDFMQCEYCGKEIDWYYYELPPVPDCTPEDYPDLQFKVHMMCKECLKKLQESRKR